MSKSGLADLPALVVVALYHILEAVISRYLSFILTTLPLGLLI